MKTLTDIHVEIAKKMPRCLDDLEMKYEFEFDEEHDRISDSCSTQFYSVGDGKGIRVKYDRMNDDLACPDYAFQSLKDSYFRFKVADYFSKEVLGGVKLLPDLDGMYLAREMNTGIYCPVLCLEDLGERIVDKMPEGPEKDYAVKSFVSKANMVAPYLLNGDLILSGKYEDIDNLMYGPDIRLGNAIWSPDDVETYLIDPDKWDFRSDCLD